MSLLMPLYTLVTLVYQKSPDYQFSMCFLRAMLTLIILLNALEMKFQISMRKFAYFTMSARFILSVSS